VHAEFYKEVTNFT
jgi:hypothetical protein